MSRVRDSADAATITVTVTFFADLRRFLPRGANGPQRYSLAPGATVADLLDTIGIEPDTDLTAAVDGELAARDTALHDGAEVMLLSPMEGGADMQPASAFRHHGGQEISLASTFGVPRVKKPGT